MSKPNGSPGAGGLAAVAATKSRSDEWVDALEGLLGLPEGALRRDFPGEAPGLFDGSRKDAQARALAEARSADRARAAASLRSAAGGFGPAAPGRAERQAG